ncbi:MiaB/RimO family radical SAM methylthiotransferase [Ahrensia sp. AH-315-G08]|nr:MiaB/RimO family radical SAM methylthiotransferase [Ahrensia sp. AH-315-G08]
MTFANNPPHPKVFIKTWGCQMNVYDSTRIQDALEQDGYVHTTDMEDADLVLLNTCHIREKAAEKVYSSLGRIRKIKNKRAETDRPMIVGVTGCVAQAEGREIIRREKIVDLVVGPQTYHRIGEVVQKAKTEGPQVLTEYTVEDKFEHMPLAKKAQVRRRGVAAFLTVQEGCDKFCTFCVVPYTRGAEVSRPATQILTEARSLVDAGVREITLLGQNVNAWHGSSASGTDMGLGELLHELAKIVGIERLRYVTSHSNDMDDSLIAAHRDLPVLMPYLHLPVQSGSDKILKSMNRNHTSADYLAVIAKGISTVVNDHGGAVKTLMAKFDKILPDFLLNRIDDDKNRFIDGGVPKDLALTLARLPIAGLIPDILYAAQRTKKSLDTTADVFFAITEAFRIGKIVEAARSVEAEDFYDKLALDRALQSLHVARRDIVIDVLKGKGNADTWLSAHKTGVERTREQMADIIENDTASVSRLTVAANILGDLARG